MASTSKKPSDSDLQKILAPTAAKMVDVEKCKDNRSEVKEHLNTIAEGAGETALPSQHFRHTSSLLAAALSWVTLVAGPGQQAPAPFIKETVAFLTCFCPFHSDALQFQVGAAQMWGNKILQKYRNEPGSEAAQHVAFVKGFVALLQGLEAYVKANHATSLSWKASGGDALAAHSAASGNSSAPTSSGPPPPGPPPPGPPPGFWKDDKAPAPAAAKTGAFIQCAPAAIN